MVKWTAIRACLNFLHVYWLDAMPIAVTIQLKTFIHLKKWGHLTIIHLSNIKTFVWNNVFQSVEHLVNVFGFNMACGGCFTERNVSSLPSSVSSLHNFLVQVFFVAWTGILIYKYCSKIYQKCFLFFFVYRFGVLLLFEAYDHQILLFSIKQEKIIIEKTS